MFHGLVFLPVILSTIGSPAYQHATAAPRVPVPAEIKTNPENGAAKVEDSTGCLPALDEDKLVPLEGSEINGHTQVNNGQGFVECTNIIILYVFILVQTLRFSQH